MGDLEIARLPPINDFSEEVSQLAEGKEQAVAEVGAQRGQIRNGYHLRPLKPPKLSWKLELANNGCLIWNGLNWIPTHLFPVLLFSGFSV